jgi:ribosomal protein S18 acetylase RimI-like enzyme
VISVRPAVAADVAPIADIHATRIRDGFLVQLGQPFLRRLYRRAVRSPRAIVLVITEHDVVGGFVAGATDTAAFYREFLIHDALVAGLTALPRIVRGLRSVLETLRYGVREDETLPKAEILAVAVREDVLGRGAGTKLVASVLDRFLERDVASVRVVTATENHRAIRMYERAGFRRRGTTYVHRDVAQAVLVWP